MGLTDLEATTSLMQAAALMDGLQVPGIGATHWKRKDISPLFC